MIRITLNGAGAKNCRMKRIILVIAILFHLDAIYGASRPANVFEAEVDAVQDECSSLLSSNLIDEIRSYQPVVNHIAAAALNGKFSGSTWKRLVDVHSLHC